MPLGLIAPSTPVHLGVLPDSSDKTGYLNLNGASPPELLVVYQ